MMALFCSMEKSCVNDERIIAKQAVKTGRNKNEEKRKKQKDHCRRDRCGTGGSDDHSDDTSVSDLILGV